MGERGKTVAQVLAIALLAVICGAIVHKGYMDVMALAREHTGGDFWKALARHVFKNLAG